MNLFNYIKNTINPEIAAQMASSVAWRIDTMLQQQARTMLKDMKPELMEKGVEEFNNLEAEIAKVAYDEYATSQMGLNATGPISTIQSLNNLRDDAHNLAKELTNLTFDKEGVGRNYEIPSLDDVFFNPVKMPVKSVSIQRATRSAIRSAQAYGLSQAQTENKVAKTLKRKEEKAADLSRVLTDQQPTVNTLYRMASKAEHAENVAKDFDGLSKETQLTLLLAARDGAARLAEWAQDYYWLSENEYDDIDSCATKVATDLNRHITYLQKNTEQV